jgi:cation transport ATPase
VDAAGWAAGSPAPACGYSLMPGGCPQRDHRQERGHPGNARAGRTVAFDKTGTLTHGEPAVVEVRAVGGISGKELLGLVASAEQYSSHVLARSLIEAAHTRGVLLQAADTASEVATDGVRATIAGREVAVGKERFVAEHAANVPAAVVSSGQLAVYVSIDKAFAGTVVLSDRIRENAAATLAALA